MRKLLFILFFFLPQFIFSQKVNIKIDDFTNDTIISTSWEKIYSGGMTGKNQTRLQIKQSGSAYYLLFRIYTNDVVAIHKDSKILIKTSNEIATAIVCDYSISEPGAWSPKYINNNLGIYFKCLVNIDDLKNKQIEKIRIPFSDGNLDLEIKKNDNNKIQKMVSLILSSKK